MSQGQQLSGTSRKASRSPTGSEAVSPAVTSRPVSVPSGNSSRDDRGSAPHSRAGEGFPQHHGTLGVSNILNAPESRAYVEAGGQAALPRFSGSAVAPPGPPSSFPHPASGTYFPHVQTQDSQPGNLFDQTHSTTRDSRLDFGPASSSAAGMALRSGQSPRRSLPLSPRGSAPNLHSPRRILSPTLPRASGANYGAPNLEPGIFPFSTAASPAKRSFEPDHSGDDRERRPPFAAGSYAPGLPTTQNASTIAPTRSASQPLTRPIGALYPPPSSTLPGDLQPRPPASLPPSHFGPDLQQNRSFPGATLESEGGSSWTSQGQQPAPNAPGLPDGREQAYIALPGADSPIPVQVDRMQGSKKANEKRHRNAQASTRHRAKKKTIQEETTRELQDLRDERQALEEKVQHLSYERDFYRNERQRLREIVWRNPSTRELADGPPSPPVWPAPVEAYVAPVPNPSPYSQQQALPPSQSFGGDASSMERPSQRRRTGEPDNLPPRPQEAQAVDASIQLTPQSGLPPPSRTPSASPSASGPLERLPPLRGLDERPFDPGHGTQALQQDPRTGQWVPAPARTYETGWATSRRPSDGPPG